MLMLARPIRLLSMLLATIASPVYGNMCCQGAYLTMPIMNGTCPLAPLDSVPYNIHKECAGLCCSTRIEIRPSNQTSDGYFAVACVAGLSEWEHGIQDIRNIFSKNNIIGTVGDKCVIFEPQSTNESNSQVEPPGRWWLEPQGPVTTSCVGSSGPAVTGLVEPPSPSVTGWVKRSASDKIARANWLVCMCLFTLTVLISGNSHDQHKPV